MAPKPEQEMYKTLRTLAPIARTLLDLEDVFETGLGLKSNLAAMESRKAALGSEIADVLQQVQNARAEHAKIRGELDAARQDYASQHKDEQDALHAARSTRAKQDAEEAGAIKARHEALAASLRSERGQLQAAVEDLKQQKSALLKDLDETLTKYARR